MQILRSGLFWRWTLGALLVFGSFFAWELGYLPFLPTLPRIAPTQIEHVFSGTLALLLAVNVSLLRWRSHYGSCPIGTKRATSIGGLVGVVTLLCPVCLLLPISIFGLSLSLAILAPYLPLLRIIALILVGVSTWMLWPKDTTK